MAARQFTYGEQTHRASRTNKNWQHYNMYKTRARAVDWANWSCRASFLAGLGWNCDLYTHSHNLPKQDILLAHDRLYIILLHSQPSLGLATLKFCYDLLMGITCRETTPPNSKVAFNKNKCNITGYKMWLTASQGWGGVLIVLLMALQTLQVGCASQWVHTDELNPTQEVLRTI